MEKRIRQAVSNDINQAQTDSENSGLEKRKGRIRQPVNHNRHRSESIIIPPREYKKNTSEETMSSMTRRHKVEEELLRACISENMSREQCMKTLELTESGLQVVEKRLFANDGTRFTSKSTALRYYEYVLNQEQCLRDLDHIVEVIDRDMKDWQEGYEDVKDKMAALPVGRGELMKQLPPRPSLQVAVMAIKAKSSIHGETIKMGQDLGIIEKRAKEVRVSGNINLGAMPTEKLRVMLDDKMTEMQALVQRGKLPPVFQKMMRQEKTNANRLPARSDNDEHNLDSSENSEIIDG